MRKLGEQWIEEIDGKMHILKAAEARNKGHVCNGCAFNNGTCDYQGDECPVPKGCYIKDLGILNKDGCLPAPWDSTKYPKITVLIGNVYNIEVMEGFWFMQVRGDTLEKAIERWNRRA